MIGILSHNSLAKTPSNTLTKKTSNNNIHNFLKEINGEQNDKNILPLQCNQLLEISNSNIIRKLSESNQSNNFYEQSFSPKKKSFNLWSFRKSVHKKASFANPQHVTVSLSSVDSFTAKKKIQSCKSKTFDGTSNEYEDDLNNKSQSCDEITLNQLSMASSLSKVSSSKTSLDDQPLTRWQEYNSSFKRFCINVLDAVSQTSENSNLMCNTNKTILTKSSKKKKKQKKISNDTFFQYQTSTKLSPYTLKRDVKRCVNETHIFFEMGTALQDIVVWKNPFTTLLLFVIYMYSVLRGWLIPLIFLLVLTQLGLNWLESQKKINFGLFLFPRRSITRTQRKSDYSGAQLVFDVARQAQIILTSISDVLEKTRHLFQWSRPEVTIKFLYILLTFFILSLILSTSSWFIVIGFLIGGKIFFMTLLYHRFPKLRPFFDIAYYFYRNLPTSLQIYNSKSDKLKTDLALTSKATDNSFCHSSLRNYANARRASSVDVVVAVATKGTGISSSNSNFSSSYLKAENSPMMVSALLSPRFATSAVDAQKRQNSVCSFQPEKHFSNIFSSVKAIRPKDDIKRRSSVNALVLQTLPTLLTCNERKHSRPLSPKDYSSVSKLNSKLKHINFKPKQSYSLPITPVPPISIEESNVDKTLASKDTLISLTLEEKFEDVHKFSNCKCASLNSLSPNNQLLPLARYQPNNLPVNQLQLNVSDKEQLSDSTECENKEENDTTSISSCSYNAFQSFIQISRTCFFVIKSKTCPKKIFFGTLTLNDRTLSFQFENHQNESSIGEKQSKLNKMRHRNSLLVNCNKHTSTSTFIILFKHVIRLKKIKSNSLHSSTSKLGNAVGQLIKKKVDTVSTTSSRNGIELHLSLSVFWSRRENSDILGQKFLSKNDEEVIVRFKNISQCNEFYESLIETARICAGIELMHDNGESAN